jgi:hypothetical protein
MITPTIIKVVYYILIGVSVLMSLGMILAGFNMPYGGGLQVFMGLVMLVLSPLFVRLYCEILIVVFKIYEKLGSIDAKMGGSFTKSESEGNEL